MIDQIPTWLIAFLAGVIVALVVAVMRKKGVSKEAVEKAKNLLKLLLPLVEDPDVKAILEVVIAVLAFETGEITPEEYRKVIEKSEEVLSKSRRNVAKIAREIIGRLI